MVAAGGGGGGRKKLLLSDSLCPQEARVGVNSLCSQGASSF